MVNYRNKSDLRIRRTHKLLAKALVELMIQPKQKYSSVTILLIRFLLVCWYIEQHFINTLKIKMPY
ncbi:hypothetical protein CON32_17880 [Bacillus cereus]|nr:hypothetical protein CON32_17880 [Bacillus cereus]